MSSIRRWRPVLAVLAGCLLLAACEAPPPDVTFYGNRTAVDTGPTRWCVIDVASQSGDCSSADTPRLTIGQGQSVQINVPSEIGRWRVSFRYLDKDRQVIDVERDPFDDGRLAYTIKPFSPQDQLLCVKVRSDPIVTTSGQGGASLGTWDLVVDPRQPALNVSAAC